MLILLGRNDQPKSCAFFSLQIIFRKIPHMTEMLKDEVLRAKDKNPARFEFKNF